MTSINEENWYRILKHLATRSTARPHRLNEFFIKEFPGVEEKELINAIQYSINMKPKPFLYRHASFIGKLTGFSLANHEILAQITPAGVEYVKEREFNPSSVRKNKS